jgi:hypothetical protein
MEGRKEGKRCQIATCVIAQQHVVLFFSKHQAPMDDDDDIRFRVDDEGFTLMKKRFRVEDGRRVG